MIEERGDAEVIDILLIDRRDNLVGAEPAADVRLDIGVDLGFVAIGESGRRGGRKCSGGQRSGEDSSFHLVPSLGIGVALRLVLGMWYANNSNNIAVTRWQFPLVPGGDISEARPVAGTGQAWF
jgi:hypothetical protein